MNSEFNRGSERSDREYVFENFDCGALSHGFLLKHSPYLMPTQERSFYQVHPDTVMIDYGVFSPPSGLLERPTVTIRQEDGNLYLNCTCQLPKRTLCEHQAQVLYNIMDRKELRIFFDRELRQRRFKEVAADYSMQDVPDPARHFELVYVDKSVEIKPKRQELLPITEATRQLLEQNLLPIKRTIPAPVGVDESSRQRILVFTQNRFQDRFCVELFEAESTREGKVKNPLVPVNALSYIWKLKDSEEIKFYSSISGFQNQYRQGSPESEWDGLRALAKNPAGIRMFYHNLKVSDSISAGSIVPVTFRETGIEVGLSVHVKEGFYEVEGQLKVGNTTLDLAHVTIRFDYFVVVGDVMYLIDNEDVLRVVDFFKRRNNRILIHESGFEKFQRDVLERIEDTVSVSYSYLKKATPTQRQENGFDREPEPVIYLTDEAHHVIITPFMLYGNVEVPVFSKKQIHSIDSNGKPFTVERSESLEINLIAAISNQHPDFQDQIGLGYFYLHKKAFLDEGWFLAAFEFWKSQGITVLGFSELKNNRLNPNRISVSVSVVSGINWFDTTLKIQFGEQEVSLKHLQKAIRNKSKFVELGDGTLGILPQEWIDKFARYFELGDVAGEVIRTPRINFPDIARLYEEEELTPPVKDLLRLYTEKFADFRSIKAVNVPEGLTTALRDYQKEGLNWLNFLDEFDFGGCLADDMGLGKTVQIIAFLLLQKEKHGSIPSLVVVPTSLLFNWQSEVEKFAPSLNIQVIYGQGRIKDTSQLDRCDLVLTSYGTLLTDIRFLKEYRFNYVILDESQTIKNPESQRYKAVRLLQSRNKLVLTGTPVENNTFDLYAQLSFACPGLLGNKHYFKRYYSTPIDRFKDRQRAAELQRKISPFVLRRTKKQVATELPDKTEVVLFCEMGEEQRKVYNAYEKEFRNFLNDQAEEDLEHNRMHILQGLTKLRQICNSPALLNDDEFYGDASSKIDVLMENIRSQSGQHKILVFSQFVRMLDLVKNELETEGIGFEYLTGQTKDREFKVNNFQNNPSSRVFLISLKAGGVGLNLTEADYVYLVDPWWNPAVENQAIDRSYRLGQKKNVVAVRLICPDTIEEKMMNLQDFKRDLADDLIKTDTSILKSLTKETLLGLLSH